MSTGVSLVVVLHPAKAIANGVDFEPYLKGLSITAYEVEFNNPTLLPEPPHTLIGSASYTVANDTSNTIWLLTDTFGVKLYSAAVAVIDVSNAILSKYTSPESLVNVVLKATRNSYDLRDHSVNYDVTLWGTTTSPYSVPVLNTLGTSGMNAAALTLDGTQPTDPNGVVGLYMPLPDPQFDPGTGITYLVPPDDGSPPAYDQLQSAVNAILAEDPTGKSNPPDLSADHCLHIARELVSNRFAAPLPLPPDFIGDLYTDSSKDTDRTHFESGLQSYYSNLEAEASRLAGYIYAWSAGKACQAMADNATGAAIEFPVRVTSAPGVGQSGEATVVVHN